MGAWGTGTFDDDSALDWVWVLVASGEPRGVLADALSLPDGYVDVDDGTACLAAAEVVHALLRGPRDGLPVDLLEWVSAHDGLDVEDLQASAASGCARVLGEDSELEELWSETPEEYPTWRAGVESLRAALAG